MVISKVKEKAAAFHSEFKKQTSTAIIAAFGLIIALSWKDVITDLVSRINPADKNLWLSALIVTIISIAGIALISKWANSKEQKESKDSSTSRMKKEEEKK